MIHESGISHKEFEELFPTLHKVRIELMKNKYKIYVSYPIYNIIRRLHTTWNKITHNSCNASPNFENIKLCTEKIHNYFDIILKKFRLVNH